MQPPTRWSTFRRSFQFKLFSIFTLITLLLSSLLTTLYVTREIRIARHEASEKLQLRTEKLADAIRLPLYANNLRVLQALAIQAAATPETLSVFIYSPNGTMLVEAPGDAQKTPFQTKALSCSVAVFSNPLFDSAEESLAGANGTAPTQLGKVTIDRSTDALTRSIRQIILASSTIAAIFWLSVSLFSFLALRTVTSSFNNLMRGIQILQEGDFATRIPVISNDEPGRAAHAINTLADVLQRRGEENHRLQEERLALERQMLQAQKLESLGVMAGGIAHDFNNLLHSILGNMELAKMKLDSGSAPLECINSAMGSAQRAALLTGLMLTYVGKGIVARTELDLNEVIEANVELLKTAATATIYREMHLAPGLPHILADEAHIQQLVMNLITNASESITGSSGTVTLTTGVQECDQAFLDASLLEEKAPAGRYVFMEVSDTGCGMDEATLKRLFDPFFTTKFTGRGLGMSAVLGIMRTHRGALYVESRTGVGTTFRAFFPAVALRGTAPLEKIAAPVPPPMVASEQSTPRTALVVDDEKAVLRVCTKMVSLCGFTVITAVNGSDAVAKFRKHADEISLVLMDLTMPGMDGISAMNEIFVIKPEVRVILASGFNREELGDRITGQPPSSFIRKPYSMAVLEAEIHRVMAEG